MTDRIQTLTVVLEGDYREDSPAVDNLIQAILPIWENKLNAPLLLEARGGFGPSFELYIKGVSDVGEP